MNKIFRFNLINSSILNNENDLHLNFCFHSNFSNTCCNYLNKSNNEEESSEAETAPGPIIDSENKTLANYENNEIISYGKEERQSIKSRNYLKKNTSLALEYREKSEKPPYTYISLIAKAIQVN